jgi:hypothetical protein
VSTTPQQQIGIVLFDGVEELDAIGPWEVLSYWTHEYPDDGFAVFSLSPPGGQGQCAKGLPLHEIRCPHLGTTSCS